MWWFCHESHIGFIPMDSSILHSMHLFPSIISGRWIGFGTTIQLNLAVFFNPIEQGWPHCNSRTVQDLKKVNFYSYVTYVRNLKPILELQKKARLWLPLVAPFGCGPYRWPWFDHLSRLQATSVCWSWLHLWSKRFQCCTSRYLSQCCHWSTIEWLKKLFRQSTGKPQATIRLLSLELVFVLW